MKYKVIIAGLTLATAACATTDDHLSRYNAMSCRELAFTIDREKDALEDERLSALGNAIEGTFGNRRDRDDKLLAAQIDDASGDKREYLIRELEGMYHDRCWRR